MMGKEVGNGRALETVVIIYRIGMHKRSLTFLEEGIED